MANRKRHVKTNTFKRNVINITGEYDPEKIGRVEAEDKNSRSITVYAREYYRKHKGSIDAAMNEARKEGRLTTKLDNEQAFVEMSESLLLEQSSFAKKTTLNERLQGLVDEMKGADPNIRKIKREAEGREDAGFEDLRKLNGRVNGKEIKFDGPDGIIGYFEIANSEYVIVHRLDYQYSATSPTNVYEYRRKSEVFGTEGE